MPRYAYRGQISGSVPEVGPVTPGCIIEPTTDTMLAAIRERNDFVEVDDAGEPITAPQPEVVSQDAPAADAVPAQASTPSGPVVPAPPQAPEAAPVTPEENR